MAVVESGEAAFEVTLPIVRHNIPYTTYPCGEQTPKFNFVQCTANEVII